MKYIALVTLLGLTACTTGNGPFYIASLPARDPSTCDPIEGATQGWIPLLDVAADPDVSIWALLAGFDSFSEAQTQPALVVGTRRLTVPQRDRAMVQRVVLRYSSRPTIPGINTSLVDTLPLTVPLSIERDEYILQVPIFGPNVRQRFRDMPASNTDKYQFTVSIELQGITDPSNAEWRTTPTPFAVHELVKSEIACANPADGRVKRLASPLYCSYAGLGRRVDNSICCNLPTPTEVNPLEPGCDVPL